MAEKRGAAKQTRGTLSGDFPPKTKMFSADNTPKIHQSRYFATPLYKIFFIFLQLICLFSFKYLDFSDYLWNWLNFLSVKRFQKKLFHSTLFIIIHKTSVL